jgi:hypothetical protein
MVKNNKRDMSVQIIFYCWIFISGIAQSVNAEEDAACWPMKKCIEKTAEYKGTSSATDFHLCIDAPCPSLTRPSLTPSGGKALWACLFDNPGQEDSPFELKVDSDNILDKDSVGRALGLKNGADLYCKLGPSRKDPFGGGAKHPIDIECSTSALIGSKRFDSEEVYVFRDHNSSLSFHTEHGWGSIENQGFAYQRYSFQCTLAASDLSMPPTR